MLAILDSGYPQQMAPRHPDHLIRINDRAATSGPPIVVLTKTEQAKLVRRTRGSITYAFRQIASQYDGLAVRGNPS
jgi:hypothetical protein